jgi:hypothetical protein
MDVKDRLEGKTRQGQLVLLVTQAGTEVIPRPNRW